jgi:hypothetical protein
MRQVIHSVGIMKRDAISIDTLWRLAFRLLIAIAFALLWPGRTPGAATAVLLSLLAAGCLVGAIVRGEAPFGEGLNRWHEAAVLLVISCVIFLTF